MASSVKSDGVDAAEDEASRRALAALLVRAWPRELLRAPLSVLLLSLRTDAAARTQASAIRDAQVSLASAAPQTAPQLAAEVSHARLETHTCARAVLGCCARKHSDAASVGGSP